MRERRALALSRAALLFAREWISSKVPKGANYGEKNLPILTTDWRRQERKEKNWIDTRPSKLLLLRPVSTFTRSLFGAKFPAPAAGASCVRDVGSAHLRSLITLSVLIVILTGGIVLILGCGGRSYISRQNKTHITFSHGKKHKSSFVGLGRVWSSRRNSRSYSLARSDLKKITIYILNHQSIRKQSMLVREQKFALYLFCTSCSLSEIFARKTALWKLKIAISCVKRAWKVYRAVAGKKYRLY